MKSAKKFVLLDDDIVIRKSNSTNEILHSICNVIIIEREVEAIMVRDGFDGVKIMYDPYIVIKGTRNYTYIPGYSSSFTKEEIKKDVIDNYAKKALNYFNMEVAEIL